MKLNFYKVLPEYFKLGDSYTFNIYLYDPARNQRLVDVYASTELTQEHLDKWNLFIEKGAYLQVYFEDKEAFYKECEKEYLDFEKANPEYFKLLKLHESRLEKFESKSKETFLLRSVLNKISESDDHKILIDRVKAEVMCFPLHLSPTVSICTELVDKLFVRDILPVRVACFAYMLAKQNKITDTEMLASLIVACLTQNLGFGLIDSSLFSEFNKLQFNDIYLKHPMLSIYILSKTGFEFDANTKRLILEHHEQIDGSGFPRQKKEDHTAYLSYIVNMSDQIMMYSQGKVNGRKTSLMKAIELFHKQVQTEGVNMKYPLRLSESLGVFLLNDLENELKP